MKISEFSKKFGVSNDTIRYYISCSLISPDKIHNQYYFNKENENQMKELLELRELKFSISEMQKIMSIKRFITYVDIKEKNIIEEILINKKNEIKEEIENSVKSLDIIEKKLSLLKKEENIKYEKTEIGFPVMLINKLICPKCKKLLSLNAKSIKNNLIFEGTLNCDCNYSAEIEDGILKIEEYEDKKVQPYIDLEKDYDKNATPALTSIVEKSNFWLKSKIEKEDLNNKIFLEMVSAQGNIFPILKEYLYNNSYYILASFNFSYLKEAKTHFEKQGIKNIVLIAGNYTKLPFSFESIDFVIDMLGTNYYNNIKGESPIKELKKYIKINGYLYTFFVHLDKYAKTFKKLDSDKKSLYIFEDIKDYYINNNFEVLENKKIGEMDKFGTHIKGAEEGDIVSFSALLLKKI